MKITPIVGYSVNSGKQTKVFCPICGCIHCHGEGVGSRVPHCIDLSNDEYDIVEIRDEPMPKDREKLGKANERRAWRAKRTGKEYIPQWPDDAGVGGVCQ